MNNTNTNTCLRIGFIVATAAGVFAGSACHRASHAANVSFPASNEVSGWTKTAEVRVFQAEDLWKYIDGEAERYLKSGVQRVHTADYKFQNAVEATVDIYVMGSAEDALKVFASEPTATAKQVQLGDAARLYSQSLVFCKGPYLVRIVAFQESGEVPRALLELSRNIDQRLRK